MPGFRRLRQAEWKNSADIKASYAHASIVGADRVVFNIKGNAFRLVVAVDYGEPRSLSNGWERTSSTTQST